MTKKLSLFISLFVISSSTVFAITASGPWTFNDPNAPQSGTITLEFPAEGGVVSGNMSGGSSNFSLGYNVTFNGNFTGGLEGTFEGEYNGSNTYTWPNPKTGQNETTTSPISGTWTAFLNEDGTMPVALNSSGFSYTVTANYDVEKFKKEYAISEPQTDAEENKDIAKLSNISGAYMIIDGKKVDIETPEPGKHTYLRPGVTVGTYDKNSNLSLKFGDTGDGSEVSISGEGSEVTVYLSEDINEEQWKKIMDSSPPSALLKMGPGKMIVKYKTGGREGYLDPEAMKNASDDSGVIDSGGNYSLTIEGSQDKLDMMYVMFQIPSSGVDISEFSELSEAIGNVGGLRDFGHKAPPLEVVMPELSEEEMKEEASAGNFFWGLFAKNESEVEYYYNGEEGSIKVYEGKVTLYKTDFKGNATIAAEIPAGKGISFNVTKDINSDDIFDFDTQSGVVPKGETTWWKENILYLGGGVLLTLIVSVFFIFRRRKK